MFVRLFVITFNVLVTGVDSSEEDDSDVDEVLPYQQEWLLSSSDSEKDDEDLYV
jgi:hypothetical protein